jgi:hypothetical protein
MDPLEQLGIVGPERAAIARRAAHARVHAIDAGDHRFRAAARPVHGQHRRMGGAPEPVDGPFPKRRVLPHARADARLGQLQQDGSHAADVHGQRILEDAPRHGAGSDQGRLVVRMKKDRVGVPVGIDQIREPVFDDAQRHP